MGQVINGIRGIFSYHRTTLRMMTSSVTMTCFLAISVCNAKQTFMLYERKVGQERKRKDIYQGSSKISFEKRRN